MITKIDFIPQRIAERLKPLPNWALISITDPDDDGCIGGGPATLKRGWKYLLRLRFGDVDDTSNSYAFHDGHAQSIVDFLTKLPDTVDTLIVHCHAGISRSAAVAKFAADFFDVEDFNHGYTLYNKLVYRILRNVAWGKIIDVQSSLNGV
jgi:rhodanese-related sulfurtransferase